MCFEATTVSQQTKHEGPDAETLKWNGVIIMIHAFQLLQNVCDDEGLAGKCDETRAAFQYFLVPCLQG